MKNLAGFKSFYCITSLCKPIESLKIGIKKQVFLLILFTIYSLHSLATTYYNITNSDPTVLTNWSQASDGSGSLHPASFANAGDVFNLYNGTTCTTANSADFNGTTLNVGNGISTINLVVAVTHPITNTGGYTNVAANATVTLSNGVNFPTFGTLAASSTVIYNKALSVQTIVSATYGNLTINNGSTDPLAGDITINGLLTLTSGKIQIGSYTVTLNGTVSGMNTSNYLIGSATSNLIIGASSSLGTLYFDQTTPSTTNNIATFTLSTSVGAVLIGSALSVSSSLTIGSGTTLDMGTNILSGAFTPSLSGTLSTQCTNANSIPSGLTWGGTVNYKATSTIQYMQIGTFNNITLANHGSNAVIMKPGTINCSGAFTAISGSTNFTNTSNTFVYSNTSGGQNVANVIYNNLTMGNSSGTNTVGSDIIVNATFTTTAGGTLDMGTYILDLEGTITNNGTVSTEKTSGAFIGLGHTWGGTGTVAYLAASPQSVVGNASTYTYNNLTIGNGAYTYTASNLIAINGQLTINSGSTFSMSTYGLTGAAMTTSMSGGTFVTQSTANPAVPTGRTWGGTVNFNTTTGTTRIPAGTFNNVGVNCNANAATFLGVETIGGDLTINTATGIVSLNGAITVGGNLSVTGTAQNVFISSSYQISVAGNWTVNSSTVGANPIFDAGAGTVIFNGSGTQTISAAGSVAMPNFYNFKNSNTGGTVTINNNTTIGNDLTNDLNATISVGSSTILCGGNWTNNGSFAAGTGTVNMNAGSGSHTLSGNMTTSNKFNNLTFSTAVTWSFGANATDVAGNFTISNGTANITAPSTTLKVAGNFANSGIFTHNSGTVELNGATGQTIPGGATTFNNLNISNTGGTILANAALTVNGTLTGGSGVNLNMTTFALLGSGTPSWSGNLQTQYSSTAPIPVGKTWGGTVTYNSTTTPMTISQGTYNNLTITGTSGSRTFSSGTTTVNGNFNVGDASTTTGITSLNGTLNVVGNITIGSSTTANIFDVTSSNYQINVGGNWTQYSTAATNPFNAQSGTVVFNGTLGTQTISTSGGTSAPSFYNLTANNSSYALLINSSTNVSHTFSVSASALITPLAAVQLNAGGAGSSSISGSGTIQVTRTAATVDYSSQYKFATNTLSALTVDYTANAAQNVNSFTYGTLKTSTGGVKTVTGGDITVNTALNIGSGTSLDFGTANRLVSGSSPTYTNNGILKTSVPTTTSTSPIPSGISWGASGTIEYSALSGTQTIVSGTYNNLQLDNTSGTNALGTAVTVNGVLTLGDLSLGANTLTLGSSASISGNSTSNYIVATGAGKLRKLLSANGSFTYPVGDATNYSPVTLVITGSSYSGAYIDVNVTTFKHPNNGSTTDYLTRYWTISQNGITGGQYDATATYVSGDVHGTESTIKGGCYSGSLPWVKYSLLNTGAKTVSLTGILSATASITGMTGNNPSGSISPVNPLFCNGTTTTMTVTPVGDAPFTYTWAPNSNITATTGAIVTANPTSATIVYTVTITDVDGITGTVTNTVTAIPMPSSTGATNSSPVCTSVPVTLFSNSSNANTWSWTGPSGYTSSLQNPVITPTVTGTYSLTVSSTGIGCNSPTVYTTVVTVTAGPTSTGATNSGPVCVGTNVTLNDNSSNATDWLWAGPSGYSSTLQSPVITPVISGIYSLTISTPGCAPVNVYTTSVTVSPMPTLSAANNSSPICAGATLDLTVAGASSVTAYQWNGPAGITSATSASASVPSATIGASGIYTVIVTNGGGAGCVNQYTTAATVNPVPSLTSANNDGSICAGATLNLSVTGASNVTGYLWSGPVAITSFTSTSASIPSATTAANGVYTVTVNNGLGAGCSAQYTTAAIVNSAPSLTSANNDGPLCAGSTLNLSVSGAANVAGYVWSGPVAITTSTSASASVPSTTTAANGTYTVTVDNGVGTGCSATYTTNATVRALPSITSISNDGPICAGITLNLSSLGASNITAYQWAGPVAITSSTSANASVPTATTGANGTYTLTINNGSGTGCAVQYTTAATVSPLPSLSSANNNGPVCAGATLNLSVSGVSNVTGYLWTGPVSITTPISASASVPSSTTSASGTYTVTVNNGSGTGCTAKYTTTATVRPAPSITSANNDGPMCAGTTLNLSVTGATNVTSYLWSGPVAITSATAASANVPSTTIAANGIYSVTVNNLTGVGCAQTYTTAASVNAIPSSTGATNNGPIFLGGSGVLYANSNSATAWSWTGPAGFTSSIQNPTVTPTVTSTYTLTLSRPGTGCATAATYTTTLTVNSAPITGVFNLCQGGSTTLANASAGGTWISSNALVASIGSASGLFTGVAAGTAVISYSFASGGAAAKVVTVNPAPSATITNNGPMCVGGSITMSVTPLYGTNAYSWTGANLSSSTVQNPVVTPTVTTTYSLSVSSSAAPGCTTSSPVTNVVTVFPLPVAAPTNSGPICTGGTISLNSNPAGGASVFTWSGPNISTTNHQNTTATPVSSAIYTVVVSNSTGLSGCSPAIVYTTAVTVNPAPTAAPSNSGTICNGGTATLSANPASGATIYTWSGVGLSSSTAQNPVATPVVTSTYSLTVSSGSASGCSPVTVYTTTVPVNVTPSASPNNSGAICPGGIATLTANPVGANVYNWSGPNLSSTTAQNPTCNPSVTSVYSLSVANSSGYTGCNAGVIYTTTVVVNSVPPAISGIASSCIAANTTLSNSVSGSWSSSNTGIASVVSYSGVVTGVSAGTANITFTQGTGCYTTTVYTVNPTPGIVSVSGGGTFCGSAPITASGGTGGTIYFEGSNSLGTSTLIPSSSQVVNNTGNYYFRAQSAYGCWGSQGSTSVTIPTISGYSTVCVGTTSTLTTPFGSGIWTSGTTSVATVGSVSGIVTGVSTGTSLLSFVPTSGCTLTTVVTVITSPAAISGANAVCVGQTTTLSSATPGGSWSTSSPSIATVGATTGVVTGVAGALSATINYTFGIGCTVSKSVSVNSFAIITGSSSNVCQGQTLTLSDSWAGGTWSSPDASVTIGSTTGIVTGINAGTATISYATTNCTATYAVNVLPQSPITGTTSVCAGQTTTLNNAISGGLWSSAAPSIASVNSTSGIVTGIAGGLSSAISYTIGNGCIATITVNVNQAAAITGATSVCAGLTTTLANGIPGGSWSSSDISVATIGTSSGVVSGLSSGVTSITYTTAAGCQAFSPMTVNYVAPITGLNAVCQNQTITLANTSVGGIWSCGTPTLATVNTSGVVTGVAAGFTPVISYTMPSGCRATWVVTVNALAAITGPLSICQSQTATFANVNAGGAWSTSDLSMATIGSTGLATGLTVGTVTLSYALPTGCLSTTPANIVPSVDPVGGSFVCYGLTGLLTDDITPGSWQSGNTSVATIGSYSGIVTGIGTGTTIITYKVLATGCKSTMVISVHTTSGTITGGSALCAGATSTLSNASPFGIWSASDYSIVSVGSTTGIVSGLANGTSIITYSTGCGTDATKLVTVSNSIITGTFSICSGTTTTLSNATSGGIWTSSNASIATVGSLDGLVNGVSMGTATISYTNGGCYAIATMTVKNAPASITGIANVCPSANTTLSNTVPYGIWSSSDNGIATIGSLTGIVSGIASGTSTIIYTTGCGSDVSIGFTVNPSASSISGNGSVCVGLTTTLTDAGGGTWYSSNTGVATIDASSGVLTGITAGSSIITYTAPTGCKATAIEIVNNLPSSISGNASVCPGTSSTLTNSGGGTWSSSDVSIATIGSGSGILTGVSAGTVTITYTAGSGCFANIIATVNSIPAAISGSSSVCIGTTTTLTNTGGGTWSSSDPSKATVGSVSGIVTGIALGATYITYTVPTGCFTTLLMNVNTVPSVITGTAVMCNGASSALTDISFGGTWTSSDLTVATIGSSNGVVTGTGAGTATITYTIATGCIATKIVTVNSAPGVITGTPLVCVGASSTLSNTGIGTWSIAAGQLGIATIGAGTGILNGVSAGVLSVTYSLANGCQTTTSATVNALPSSISGTRRACVGLTSTLTDAGGGIWSSSDEAIAIVGSSSGTVTGIANGTSTITYTLATGCYTTAQFTVNPLPASISGTASVCLGFTSALSDAGGGTWSSGSTGVATIVAATGVMTGASVGTASITYTLGTGCIATTQVTVLAVPSTITGTTGICIGATGTLSDATSAGSWTSNNTSVASIDIASGILTSVSTGTSLISYTIGNGCIATKQVTINPLPAAISGVTSFGVTGSSALSCASTGGTWTSSNASIATVGISSGVVNGVSGGTATITYTLPTGCINTTSVSINAIASIIGSTDICIGYNSTLTDATPSGIWSSSNIGVATIGSLTGVINGVSAGTTTITYDIAGTGFSVATIAVHSSPLPISGGTTVCAGQNILLTNSTPGGSWSTSAPYIASVNASTGLVTGVAGGLSAVISYAIGSGCAVTTTITVNALSPISGVPSVCVGQPVTFTNATSSGTWTSSSSGMASVGTGTGLVTGIASGTTIISYATSSGCTATWSLVVNALDAISGASSVCAGQSITLTETGTGTWSSSAPSIATVGLSTGMVNGLSGGLSTTITYTTSDGCKATTVVTVNSLSAISGANAVCLGLTTVLTDAVPGGIWSSANTGVATIGTSGIVTGISAGTSDITYLLPGGCYSTINMAVNAISAISGPSSVCVGQNITLTDIGGGTWSSASPTIATVGSASGIVTGVAGGLNTTITYTLGSGCKATTTITVNSLAPITGTLSACILQSTSLADAIGGGTWSSSATSIATVNSTSGVVTGIAGGTSVISYMMPTGCVATSVVNIANLAAIIGANSVCNTQSTTFTNAISGGVWSSSAPSIASVVASTGVVTGAAGNLSATIYYTLGSGCRSSKTITVNPLAVVSGSTTKICVGQGTTLTDAVAGGSWISSSSDVSIVGSGTGIITGIGAGTNIISYVLPTGCMATYAMTVNPLAPITGAGNVCWGSTITLSNAVSGGTWASAVPTIASVVASTGVVSGLAANLSTTLTYTLGTGCRTTANVSVCAIPFAPASIGGPSSVSISGVPITLTDATGGGAWISGNTGRATVVAGTGVVTGISIGTVTISYTVSNAAGCTNQVTKIITVGPVPPPHSVTNKAVSINVDASITLNETAKGGTWLCHDCDGILSLNTEKGTITGIAQGRAIITYTVDDEIGSSSTITKVIVNPLPESVITFNKEGNVYLIPNPNKGTFTIKGNLATATDEEITIEVVDIIGQTIYKGYAKAIDGKINEQIVLSNTLANGMYLLNLHSNAEHYVFHFVVER